MDRERMDGMIAATEGRLKRAWIAMIAHLREGNSEADIAQAIRDGAEPITGINVEAARLAVGFHAAYIAAGQTTARWLDKQIRGFAKADVAKQLPVFDSAAPPAAHWAAQNRLDLIREIDTETRVLIRDILMEGARAGTNPLTVARELRESIGLTSYQRSIVENYRRELTEGRYADALKRELSHGQSDRAIAAALKNNRTLTPAQIDTAVERYRQGYIDMRARTIARTEGLRVAHQGSEELYRQAVERGDVDAEQLERTWVHAGHSATSARGGKSSRGGKAKGGDRPYHVSMSGQTRPFGEPFVSGIGGLLRYPGDPEASAEETANCRCVLTTRVLPPGGGGQQQGGGRPQGGATEAGAADAEALEEEMAALEEESATAMAEAEQLALEEELAVGADEAALAEDVGAAEDLALEPDLSPAELADLLGEEVPGEDVTGLSHGRQQHVQLQEARGRLAARRQELEAARAEVQRLEMEHAVAEREVAGMMRIGEGRIAGEIEADEVAALNELRPALRVEPVEPAPVETLPDPYRTPGVTGDTLIEVGTPAPVGFESVEFNGELYYRQQITGRSYTPAQIAERDAPTYVLELTGPNARTVPQFEGFDPLEVKLRRSENPELKYRSKKTGQTYTPADMTDGYMEGAEKIMQVEAEKPGILQRILRRLALV